MAEEAKTRHSATTLLNPATHIKFHYMYRPLMAARSWKYGMSSPGLFGLRSLFAGETSYYAAPGIGRAMSWMTRHTVNRFAGFSMSMVGKAFGGKLGDDLTRHAATVVQHGLFGAAKEGTFKRKIASIVGGSRNQMGGLQKAVYSAITEQRGLSPKQAEYISSAVARGGYKGLTDIPFLKSVMQQSVKKVGAKGSIEQILKMDKAFFKYARFGAKAWAIGNVVNLVGLAASIVAPAVYQGTRILTTDIAKMINDVSSRSVASLEWGGTLSPGFLTGQASTERQTALQEIHRSRLNARTAIGNEAALTHRGF